LEERELDRDMTLNKDIQKLLENKSKKIELYEKELNKMVK